MYEQYIWIATTCLVGLFKTYQFSEFKVMERTDLPIIELFDTPDIEDLTIFYTKASAMQPFECKELWQFQDYGNVLQDFEKQCFNEEIKEITTEGGRYPFVVIESNNKTHRNLLSKKLAERFSGKVFYNPPECLMDHAVTFKENNPLYNAFTALGIYAVSHSVKVNYIDSPVIVSGYWNYATALGLDAIFPNKTKPPPVGYDCYNFPKDLLLPDITVFVHMKNSRPPTKMYSWLLEEDEEKPRWLTFLTSMGDHPIEVIDSCIEDKAILTEIERRVDQKFLYEDK